MNERKKLQSGRGLLFSSSVRRGVVNALNLEMWRAEGEESEVMLNLIGVVARQSSRIDRKTKNTKFEK